jgi:glucose/arabinose dehydrogenase
MSRVNLTRVGLTACVALVLLNVTASATTLPTGFTEVVVASGLTQPTSFTFLPDGRMLITEKGGRIRVVKNGVLLGTPAITLAVSTESERGALCITPDPQFSSNHFVYIYYTTSAGSFQPPASPKNRVSRFTLNGDTLSSEAIILNNIFSDNKNHNGGWIQFGPDGKLYVSTGDGGLNSSNAQNVMNLSGKILRVNADGTAPTDNPFFSTAGAQACRLTGQGAGACREIWCWGLRNPWRNTFDSSGRLFIGDVGSSGANAREEINVGIKGMNYGWPNVEGVANTPGYVDPIYTYPTGGTAITVGAFSNTGAYPPQYAGSLFFADEVKSFIRTLKYNAGNNTATVSDFATNAGNPAHLGNGPDGLLYYASYGTGQIRRIEFPANSQATPVPEKYDGDNRADIATFAKPGVWSVQQSSNGQTIRTTWGLTGLKDVPVPADYDGDGRADRAVYRSNAGLSRWLILRSTGGSLTIDCGTASTLEKPVPADYDGDSRADPAVFSTVNARWRICQSSGGVTDVTFGLASDIPVPGDYDGDGEADIAVFRPSTLEWFWMPSSGGGTQTATFGKPGDVPVPRDYDGDLKTDLAIFRPSNGLWSYQPSLGGAPVGTGWGSTALGDIPAPADFDGDGKANLAVYRQSTGQWFIK